MKSMKIILLTIITSVFFSCDEKNGNQDQLSNAPHQQEKSEKRGVSYSFAGFPEDDMILLSSATTWFYNWGINLNSVIDHAAKFYDLTYVPMAWNDVNESALRAYVAEHPECKYLLAYNEPNLTDQANMTPSQAAAKWPRLLSIAKELNLKIVSPAMNYGTLSGYSDPIKWLDEFFTLIDSDDIVAISIHCYMGNASALKSYVERFKKYQKPIWMTEFCGWEKNITSATSQMEFMSEAVTYMELDPDVERYAWFIPKWNIPTDAYPYMQLLTKNMPVELTACGQVYVGMSTFDKKVYALAGQKIEAEHFVDCNMSKSIDEKGFSRPVHFRPTTDAGESLDIYNFTGGKWVDYQIELAESKTYNLSLRNIVPETAEMSIYIDGNIVEFASLSQTNTWTTTDFPVKISDGKHTIRLEVTSGNCALNWIKVESK